ncbi:hypothetical protein [Pseudidiomarina sp. PP-1MA]|uniref:hypothetical protein n=1 Tax=Pseudidiomarina sp. PP-1MA TaxID=3237706 RepID=UPI00350EBB85
MVARGLGFSESEHSFARFLRPGLAASFIRPLLPRYFEKAEAVFADVVAQIAQGHAVDLLDSLVAPLTTKPFVIGRKAQLFLKSRGGAQASAIRYSVVETAKAKGLMPLNYVTLVKGRI